MLWALDEAETSDPFELAILVALADEANSDGLECFPELRTIARRARQSVSTVRRRIAVLEQRGLLVAVRPASQGRGHHNRYGLVMAGRTPAEVRQAVELGAATFPNHHPERVPERTPSGSVKVPKGVHQGGTFSPVKVPKGSHPGWHKPDQPAATPNPPLFAGHDLPPVPAPAPPDLSMLRNQLNKRKPKP